MGKIIAKKVVVRKPGYLYYIDSDGNVCEAKMARGGKKKKNTKKTSKKAVKKVSKKAVKKVSKKAVKKTVKKKAAKKTVKKIAKKKAVKKRR